MSNQTMDHAEVKKPQTKLELAQAKMAKVKDNVKAANAKKLEITSKIKSLKEELIEAEKKFKVQQTALKAVQKTIKKIQNEGDTKLWKNSDAAAGMNLLMGMTKNTKKEKTFAEKMKFWG